MLLGPISFATTQPSLLLIAAPLALMVAATDDRLLPLIVSVLPATDADETMTGAAAYADRMSSGGEVARLPRFAIAQLLKVRLADLGCSLYIDLDDFFFTGGACGHLAIAKPIPEI